MSDVEWSGPRSKLGIPADVFGICTKLKHRGKRAWIVGGCVRDLALGHTPKDWDICTDALPHELMSIFPRAIPTGLQHGTVTLVYGREHYEVTTLRGEGAYSDGRRPDSVRFVSDIEADLARRDFTINAMALDLDHLFLPGREEQATKKNGELVDRLALIDPYGGVEDLHQRWIRAVGVARERFSEDGLRVLRAARFAAQLGFRLDPKTESAISETLVTFSKVSFERVRDEWVKTMKAKKPSTAFEIMKNTGMMQVICPELLEGVGCEQNRYHRYDVWGHAMACMDACPQDPILRISGLFHDVGKPRTRVRSEKTNDYTFYDHEVVGAEMAEPICLRLKFSNEERARICDLVRHHMWHYENWSDAAVRRFIQRVGRHRLEDLYALREADIEGKGDVEGEVTGNTSYGDDKKSSQDRANLYALKAHVERVLAAETAWSIRDLKIDGNMLMHHLHLKPGPILGELLRSLFDAVVENPEYNSEKNLLELARELYLSHQKDEKK